MFGTFLERIKSATAETAKNVLNDSETGTPAAHKLAGRLPPSLQKLNEFLVNHQLADVLPYESYDNDNQLFFNEDSTSFMLECGTLIGVSDETVRVLNSIFSQMLPQGTGIQITLWNSPNVMGSLASWARERMEDAIPGEERYDGVKHSDTRQTNIFRELARRRVEHIMKGINQSLFPDLTQVVRDFRLIISLTFPGVATNLQVSKIIQLRNAVIGALKGAALECIILDPDDLIGIVDDFINPVDKAKRERYPWDQSRLLREQVVNADTNMLVDKDGLVINDIEVRTYSVRAYPQAWALWGMEDMIGDTFSNALRIPGYFAITLNVFIPDQDSLKNQVNMKTARATQNAESQMAKYIPVYRHVKRDWDFVSKKVSDGGSLVYAYHQIVTFSKLGEGDATEQALLALYKSKSWQIQSDKFIMLQSLLASLPMTLDAHLVADLMLFKRFRLMLTYTVANMMPVISEWKGTQTKKMLLLGRKGQLMFYDNFDNKAGNYNVAVAAASGAGKSFFNQDYICSHLGARGRAWVIDVGRSYMNLCNVLNGQFIEFTEEAAPNINPFTFIKDDKDFEEHLFMLKPLVAQMACPTRNVDDWESAIIEQALKHVWGRTGNKSTVTNVAEWLNEHTDKRAKDLATQLFPYTKEGQYARFFEGDCTLNFANNFVVLELEELKTRKDLQAVVLLILMFQITTAMYLGDRSIRKVCLIDEAWDLMGAPGTAKFIENGYRTARKYGGCFITITQSVNDYYKTEATKAAYENSDWLVLLRQKPESVDEMDRTGRVSLDPYQKRLMKSVTTIHEKFSEVLIKSPAGYAVGRLVVDPFASTLYSTQAADVQIIKNLQKEHGMTLPEALGHLTELKLKKRGGK